MLRVVYLHFGPAVYYKLILSLQQSFGIITILTLYRRSAGCFI